MLYVFAVIVSFQFVLISVARSAELCHVVVANSTTQDPTLLSDIKNLLESGKINEVYQGTRPNWNHYNDVQQLILRAEKVKLKPEEKQALKNLISDKQVEIQNLVKTLHQKQIEGRTAELINPIERFLDYNIAYFRLLNKLNTILGIKIISLPILKDLPSDRKLIQEAEALVNRLEKEVEDNFTKISSHGFKSINEFNEFAKKESERSEKLIELTQNNLVVAMHRPESARFWIPVAGFQNQRVTQSSKGNLYTDTIKISEISGRDKAESNLTLTTNEEYVPKSARLKPNYAEARPNHNQSNFKPGEAATQYGSDLWVIKDDIIIRRATWTPADSLSPGRSYKNKNNGFDDVFIPWRFRNLVIPYLNYGNIFMPYELNTSFNMTANRWYRGSSYMEVQIFGPLSINDVKAFHFKNNPPDREFYELLKSKNIEIMDERTWPPKPYNGEESL